MAKIVITEFMDRVAVDRLSGQHDVLYDPDLADRLNAGPGAPEEQILADCRALIVRNRTQVREPLLAITPKLRCVGRLGVGLDNIDTARCTALDIEVYPATGANDLAVAEYVIAMTLVLLRGAYQASAEVADGSWPRGRLMGREMSGRTMGLVGFGSIAREVAKRAAALGMQVAAADPFVDAMDPAWALARRMELPVLLAEADVISLHVPLTEATRGLIGAEAIGAMKSGAILINAARGGVVDEAALAKALKTGTLGGAALDVFAQEPLPGGSVLAEVPNLVLTPHIAGVTEDSNVRVSNLIADLVLAHMEGEKTR